MSWKPSATDIAAITLDRARQNWPSYRTGHTGPFCSYAWFLFDGPWTTSTLLINIVCYFWSLSFTSWAFRHILWVNTPILCLNPFIYSKIHQKCNSNLLNIPLLRLKFIFIFLYYIYTHTLYIINKTALLLINIWSHSSNLAQPTVMRRHSWLCAKFS